MSPPPRPPLRVADLRGIAKLAVQATTGVSRIAEGVHRSVLETLGLPGAETPGQTRGLTGFIYGSVRGVAQGVGWGLDRLLGELQTRFDPDDASGAESPARDAMRSALNGVLGDHLHASANPLAIRMSWHQRGVEVGGVHPLPAAASGKLLLLIHGLCMNDRQWHTPHAGGEGDHGEALAAALGYTPLYLRYNSGRHISQNGRELAAQLESLVAQWPVALERVAILAHSMGGLLARSALHYARAAGMRWPESVRDLVFLGTPHHGAPLERAGNWIDAMLGSVRFSAPFASLGQIRSAGITDLRYGHMLDADWQDQDRFVRAPDARQILPLPEGVRCFAIAATTAARRGLLADRVLGDGLVPLHSALGQHEDPARTLAFAPDAQWIAYRTGHLALLSRPEVTHKIQHWLT